MAHNSTKLTLQSMLYEQTKLALSAAQLVPVDSQPGRRDFVKSHSTPGSPNREHSPSPHPSRTPPPKPADFQGFELLSADSKSGSNPRLASPRRSSAIAIADVGHITEQRRCSRDISEVGSPSACRVWNTLPRKSSSVDIEAKDYEPSPNAKRKRNAFGSLKQNRSQDDLTSVNKGLKAHKEGLRHFFHGRSKSKSMENDYPLHHPKNTEVLVELLRGGGWDVNSRDMLGDAPIHTIVRTKTKKRFDFLMALLVHGSPNVDLASDSTSGNAALHIAVEETDHSLVKLLLSFGAKPNSLNRNAETALDVAVRIGHNKIIELLNSVGGKNGEVYHQQFHKLPRLKSFHDTILMKRRLKKTEKSKNINESRKASTLETSGYTTNNKAVTDNGEANSPPHENGTPAPHQNGHPESLSHVSLDEVDTPKSTTTAAAAAAAGSVEQDDIEPESRERVMSHQSCECVRLVDLEDGMTLTTMYERLQQCINLTLEFSGSFSANTDEAIAITMQQKELRKYKRTVHEQPIATFDIKGGSRILFLDGGGVRGLVQIELLRQMEEATGRRITELFDWIVGTSTGGIVALGLVHAGKSLKEMRQLYFKMKDQVFSNDRFGFGYNTEVLEKLLIEEFGTELRMSDVTFPRVLISAVYKKTTLPELHFFNNCFEDEYSQQPVWKVARYTSAAPMFFTECDNYVDGGVLANNPCHYGLSAIQNYQRQQGQKLDIALVASVGTGVYPAEHLGKTDAQEFLFFGKHWLKAGRSLKKRAMNLIKLLTTALVESESVAENFKSRLTELGIPYYRFSPQLDEVIPAGETDNTKLMDMIINTRVEALGPRMRELVQMFHVVAELTRKLGEKKIREEKIKAARSVSCMT